MKTRMQKLLLGAALVGAATLAPAQFIYTNNGNGTCTITGYTGPGGAVTIPNSINGLSVVSIGDHAFYGNSSLGSVIIPNSVTSIRDEAFGFCTSLASVTIPSSVTSIGGAAFEYCISLASVTIPASVTAIGGAAFSYCYSLAITVDAANSFYSSANGVLFDKNQTTLIKFPAGQGGSYTIPNSVTRIEGAAFEYCGLTSVTIPAGVTTIGDGAFSYSGLTSVTIGKGVTSIGWYAFYDCTGLTSVTVPASVTSVGYKAFAYCSRLTAAYFLGNAPFDGGHVFEDALIYDPVIVYYLRGATGWGPFFSGRPTELWDPPQAGVRYVDVNSTNATPPYTNWATAATNIQDAVDAAVAGDEVVVSDGTYRPVNVQKPLNLRSLNGPQFTTIDGGHSGGCAYLTNSASLSGFTLTNGTGSDGGGAYGGTLNNCTLTGNSATGSSHYYQYLCGQQEGHIVWCTGYSQVPGHGGGAYGCTLNNCTLTGNSADQGGAASDSTLNNCTLTGNSGAGANSSTLNNCSLTGNSGGGADLCTLNNCTLTGNSPFGANSSTLNNCIAYFNTAPEGANNYSSSSLNYCCTTPLPNNGVGNISQDPQLASASHLSAVSPCRGAGNAAYASGTDIDGEAWASPPSIGCDEYHDGAVTGPLNVAITPSSTNVPVGLAVQLTALIEGRTTVSSWSFGDGITATNQPYIAHTWTSPGDYSVVLLACNESQPGGISATVTVHVVAQPIHYVAVDSSSPVAPYTSWATAATNIQDAVEAATEPGALVLVSDGVYAAGGRAPVRYPCCANRAAVDKPLTLRSVNGPQFTVIDGGHSVGCVYLTSGAFLSGFTLTNGVGGVFCESQTAVVSNCVMAANAAGFGGGAYGGTLNNCTLTGNSAYTGGGAFGDQYHPCTLNNCRLIGNSASWYVDGGYGNGYGGGAYSCTLNNCTLSGNQAYSGGHYVLGGGAYGCALNNCIVYFNITDGPAGDNYDYDSCTLNYCCTTPLPTYGVGNITNAPLFVDTNGWADLHLQSNSPCINAGNNAAAAGTDLDGNPRIAGGAVDIGAYEFQAPVSRISYAWLQQYGLPINAATDSGDPDGDGLTNWQEWRCGTDPTQALSALRLLAPVPVGTNLALSWPSVGGVNYFLERSANLATPPAFTALATNIPGQPGTTTYTDTNAIGAGPFLYRLGVRD